MWLNTGKFLDNGGSGYVLKPNTLITNAKNVPKQTLTVTVITNLKKRKRERKNRKHRTRVKNIN